MSKAKITADKLQEVILSKTVNSITSDPEKGKSTKKAITAKSPKKGETKAVSTKSSSKATKKSSTREVKYIYPEGCSSSLEKKKFRAEFRAKAKRFETELSKVKEGSKEYKKISKEYKEYKAQYLRG